jgi:hypothetical protein
MKNLFGPTWMAKTCLWVIMLTFLTLLCFGCSVSKHVQKSDQSSDTKTEAQAEEKTKKETLWALAVKTTTSELLDSSVVVVGSTINGSRPLSDLQIGRVLTLEDANQEVKISLDSNGNVKAEAINKPQVVPIKIKKTIQREEQLKQTVKSSSDSIGRNKSEAKTELKTQDRQVDKSIGFPWWLWLLIAVMIYLIWQFLPRIRAIIGI